MGAAAVHVTAPRSVRKQTGTDTSAAQSRVVAKSQSDALRSLHLWKLSDPGLDIQVVSWITTLRG